LFKDDVWHALGGIDRMRHMCMRKDGVDVVRLELL
jgi:hypothetical protein